MVQQHANQAQGLQTPGMYGPKQPTQSSAPTKQRGNYIFGGKVRRHAIQQFDGDMDEFVQETGKKAPPKRSPTAEAWYKRYNPIASSDEEEADSLDDDKGQQHRRHDRYDDEDDYEDGGTDNYSNLTAAGGSSQTPCCVDHSYDTPAALHGALPFGRAYPSAGGRGGGTSVLPCGT